MLTPWGQKRRKEGIKVMAKTDYADKTYRYAVIIGQVTGIVFLCGGLLLMLLGVTGAINIIVSKGTLEAKLINAAPGVVIALFGAIIIVCYKPKISSEEVHTVTRTGKGKGRVVAYSERSTTKKKRAAARARR